MPRPIANPGQPTRTIREDREPEKQPVGRQRHQSRSTPMADLGQKRLLANVRFAPIADIEAGACFELEPVSD